MQLNATSIIFIVFLTTNLIVGLIHGRGVKTIKDYALGGRNFSTAALVATMLATFMGGGGFFIAMSQTYSQGLTYILPKFAIALQLFFVAMFLVPRMGEFMGGLSVAEVMGNLYGKKVRAFTAVCGILSDIGIIAVQFKVFGNLVNYFVGFSEFWAVTIAATIVILYSAFGGIRAVTYTDVLQFFTFGFAIPMIGMIIWEQFQISHLTLSDAFANPLFDYNRLLNLPKKEMYDFIFLIVYFLFPTIYPTDFQRISMGRNIKQVKKAILITMVLFIVIFLAMAWIPFLMVNINPELEPKGVISFIINNYTHIGLKGLIIIGVSALAMSTADSAINSCAVLFAHDLKEVVGIKTDNLILSKIFALILGIAGIYLALSTDDLLDMVRDTASFYLPIVAIPLLFAVFGFRSTTKSVLAGMISAFITVIILMLTKAEEIIVPAMIVNTVVFIGYHYLLKQEGGWVGIKDRSYLEEAKIERKRKIARIINAFRFKTLIEFCRKTVPKNELMYSWLGIYFIFFTISTMYSTQVAMLQTNGRIVFYIYQIMMCTGVITAMYPIWPTRIKYEIIMQSAWHIIIFYMLIFFSCFFVMLSDFGQLQFAIFTMNIIIAALLVGWKLSLIMIIAGFYSSVEFYKYYAGIERLNISIGSPEFIFMYSLMLVGTSLIIFLKPKQEEYELIEHKNEHLTGRIEDSEKELSIASTLKSEFIRNINHEYHTPMTGITSMVQILKKAYHKLDDSLRMEAINVIYESSLRLEHFDNNLAILSKLTQPSHKLLTKPLDLSELVHERIESCRNLYESDNEEKDLKFILNIEKDVTFEGDKIYITKMLDNLIINAINYSKQGKITIILNQDKNNRSIILLSIEDEGIGIPQEELYDIFAEFTVSSRTKTPAGGRGVGLALVKRVVEIHGGKVWAKSNGYKGARFEVSLPL